MRNIVLMLALLVVPYACLGVFGVAEPLRGRVGITCVFAFTGFGHFIKGRAMSAMVPPQIPERFKMPIIYFSGMLEMAAAIAVLVPRCARGVGIALCIFLVLVLPANIDSAIRRVPFGGHSAGPVYLFARIPLQIVLIAWVLWFAVLHQQ